jgi:hypothetical protein
MQDTSEFFDVDGFDLDEGHDDLDRRAFNGRQAILRHPTYEAEDAETTASDLISDILTALFGPAGFADAEGDTTDGPNYEKAKSFLDSAFTSWEGDAEDYTREEQGDGPHRLVL